MDSDVSSDRPCRFGIRVGRTGDMTGLCGRILEGRDPPRGRRSGVAGQGSRRSRGRPRPVPALGRHHAPSRPAGRGGRGSAASPLGVGEPILSPRARSSGPTPRRTTGWGTSILARGQPDMALSQQRCREAAAARGPSPPADADPAPIGAGGSAQGRHPDRRSTLGESGVGELRSFPTLRAGLPVARPTSHVRPNRDSSRLELIETRNSGPTEKIHRLMRD